MYGFKAAKKMIAVCAEVFLTQAMLIVGRLQNRCIESMSGIIRLGFVLSLILECIAVPRVAYARLSSPGNVTFSSPTSLTTNAVFDSTGTFVLQLCASDSAKTTCLPTTVTVLAPVVSIPPNVAIGVASGVLAGNTWGVFATLSTGTVGVAALQFDATLPAGASTATVLAGTAATAAGKSVAFNPIPGGVRVLVSGVNQTLINSGVIAILNIQTDATLPTGTLAIPISNVSASDPLGVGVPITGTNGSLFVTANKAPVVTVSANQTITLPATATLTATATDDGAPTPPGTLTYQWSTL